MAKNIVDIVFQGKNLVSGVAKNVIGSLKSIKISASGIGNTISIGASKITHTLTTVGLTALKTGTILTGVGTATGGAMFALANNVARAGDSIAKTSAKLGITSDALQELRFSADLAGVAQRSFDVAMQRLTRRAAEVAQGTGIAKDAFKQLGISVIDSSGRLKSSDVLLGELADSFKGIKDQSEKVRLAFKLFDTEGVALVNVLNQGKQAINLQRQEFRNLGGVIAGDTLKASENFIDTQTKLKTALGGIKNLIGAELIPIFTDMAMSFTENIKGILPAVANFSRNIAITFSNIPEIIKKIANTAKQILIRFFSDFSYFKKFLSNLTVFIKSSIISFGKMVEGFTKIIGKVALVLWTPIITSFQALGGNLKMSWQVIMNGLKETAINMAIGIVDKLNSILPKAFEIDTAPLTDILFGIQTEVIKPAMMMEEAWKLSGNTMKEILGDIPNNFEDISKSAKKHLKVTGDLISQAMQTDEVVKLRSNIDDLFDDSHDSAKEYKTTIDDLNESLADLSSISEQTTQEQRKVWEELQGVVENFGKTKLDLANEELKSNLVLAQQFKATEEQKAAIAITGAQKILTIQDSLLIKNNQIVAGTVSQRQAWEELSAKFSEIGLSKIQIMENELQSNLNLALAVQATEEEKAALIISTAQNIHQTKQELRDREIEDIRIKKEEERILEEESIQSRLNNATNLNDALGALADRNKMRQVNTWTEIGKFVHSTGNAIQKGFAQSVAQMIVFGGSLRDNMKGIFSSIASTAISKIIDIMITDILASKAMGMAKVFQWFMGMGPLAIPAAIAAAATVGGIMTRFIPALAKGGIVDTPTLAMVGEAGPEVITPLNKLPDLLPTAKENSISMVLTDLVNQFKKGSLSKPTTQAANVPTNGANNTGNNVIIQNMEVLPNITASEALLNIPRSTLEIWIMREILPIFQNLARSNQMIDVVV